MTVDEAQPPSRVRGLAAPILFTLRTKGPRGLAERVVTVSTRFGPTPRVMADRLHRMLRSALDAGFAPTCPITTTVLARHPREIRELAARGMEISVHGLRHIDHLTLDEQTQKDEVARAVDLFVRHGIEPHGFRAPYLRADDATRAAVRAAGLSYQSDDAVVFPVRSVGDAALTDDGYRRAIEMYDAQDARTTVCRPTIDDGLVRIPVCVPDDEMLVDRLHRNDEACGEAWCDILDSTHDQGDLFTMQVHPERFVRSVVAVEAVLSRARDLPGRVWFARLDEIAEWWAARDACRVELGRSVDGSTPVTLSGDHRARLRLVGGKRAGASDNRPARTIRPPAGPIAAVGVDADTPSAVLRFLADDGFVTTSQRARECAVHLGAEASADDEMALRRRILDADHPVVAIDRWPQGARSALALTGDIDAMTAQDFLHRVRENAHGVSAAILDGPTR